MLINFANPDSLVFVLLNSCIKHRNNRINYIKDTTTTDTSSLAYMIPLMALLVM